MIKAWKVNFQWVGRNGSIRYGAIVVYGLDVPEAKANALEKLAGMPGKDAPRITSVIEWR